MQLSSEGPGGDDAGRGPEFIEEFARSTPVLARADVLVAGAGPAGTMAAIAAAEAGARVVLIDCGARPGLLAGNAVVAWIGTPMGDGADPWTDGLPADGARPGRPAHRNATDATAALLAQVPPQDLREDGGSLIANPHRLRLIALDRLRNARVAVAFGAQAVAPLLRDDAVRGVLCERAGQRFALRAAVTIDATGRTPTFTRAGSVFDAVSLMPEPPRPPAAHACLVGPVDADRWQAAVTGPADATDTAGHARLARLRQICGDAGLPYAAWAHDLMLFEPSRASGEPAEARFAFFRAHAPGFERARLLAIGPSPFTSPGGLATVPMRAAGSSDPPRASAGDPYGPASDRPDTDELCALPPAVPGQPARRLRRSELLSADHHGLLVPTRLPDRTLAARWRVGEAAGLLAALAAATRTAPHRVPADAVRRRLGQPPDRDPLGR